eukprot:scaffold2860_cov106-Isochrysis_galbana.AAC.3
MGSRAGCVSIEWTTEGVLESLALSGSDDVLVSLRDLLPFVGGAVVCCVWSTDSRVAAGVALVSERRQGLRPCLRLVVGVWRQRVPSGTSGRRRTRVLSSVVQGRVCGVRAAAVLAHTVSLGVGMLRGLLERAKLLFSIVDLVSVNGAAFRQLRVACETHTGDRRQEFRRSTNY